MLFCSDTLNARNHLPGTTILVPSVRFFFSIILYAFIVTAKFQWKSSLWHVSPKWQVFYVSVKTGFPVPIKFTKSLTWGINSEFQNANKSANNYENVSGANEILWGRVVWSCSTQLQQVFPTPRFSNDYVTNFNVAKLQFRQSHLQDIIRGVSGWAPGNQARAGCCRVCRGYMWLHNSALPPLLCSLSRRLS